MYSFPSDFFNVFHGHLPCAYRIDDNSLSATLTIDLVNGCQMRLPESGTGKIFSKCVGRGDTIPLMEMPSLSESEAGE